MAKNNPKVKLFADDPLTKVLKKEHWDLVDPFTFQLDEGASSTLPKDKFTFEVTIGDDNESEVEDPGKEKLKAPNLEDITVDGSSGTYIDASGKTRSRVVFKITNPDTTKIVDVDIRQSLTSSESGL